jgi:hypothetical protein
LIKVLVLCEEQYGITSDKWWFTFKRRLRAVQQAMVATVKHGTSIAHHARQELAWLARLPLARVACHRSPFPYNAL